jgi:hypothetical protein
MFQIVFITKNKVRLTRWHMDCCTVGLLCTIAQHVASMSCNFHSDVVSVHVSVVNPAKAARPPRALRITNLCGRIRHSYSRQFYNYGVEPMVIKTRNAFGSFETLLSVHGNLQTAQNRNNTLFRAGRSSSGILLIIEHAFDADCVQQVNMHMLVANVRLAHPVTINCQYLDARILDAPQWTGATVVMGEEQSYMKSFKLSSVCLAWQEALLGAGRADSKLAILLNVSKSGCVNIFVTIGKETPLTLGVEHTYMPMLDALVCFVDKYT